MHKELTHYTNDINTIVKILNNGFAWMPNQRNLINDFIPFHDFSNQEPQQFGMISLTELSAQNSTKHRNKFGDYGIVLSSDWCLKHNAHKVIYLDRKGPIFDAFKILFTNAYSELSSKIRFPEDEGWRRAYLNKDFAGFIGGFNWSLLLQIYEYMEPIENSYQQEWRIIHPTGIGFDDKSREKIITEVSPPKGWSKLISVLKVSNEDIVGFVCPQKDMKTLINKLHPGYQNKVFYTFSS